MIEIADGSALPFEGTFVRILDEEFSPLTTWATIENAGHVRWEPSEIVYKGLATYYLLKGTHGKSTIEQIDVPNKIAPGNTLDLDISIGFYSTH